MFERFAHSARNVVVLAQDEARRLGHGQIGSPHLLLALLGDPAPSGVGELLRENGVSAEAVERELDALLADRSSTGGQTVVADDAEALAALGIDLHRIREAVEESFGPGVLERFHDDRASGGRGLLARVFGGRLADRRDEAAALRGSWPRGAREHIPFSHGAKKALELSLREAMRLGDRTIETDHVLLGLLRAADGAAASILLRLGAGPDTLRPVIETRRRRSA
jgi:ATP-dependent Clp protease ATP-binding subunit ClpA